MPRLFLLTLASTLIFSIYATISNLQGRYCSNHDCAMQNAIYYSSVFNILDKPDSVFVQLVLWCCLSLLVLGFNLYLRYTVVEHRFYA